MRKVEIWHQALVAKDEQAAARIALHSAGSSAEKPSRRNRSPMGELQPGSCAVYAAGRSCGAPNASGWLQKR
jgi:hypothetical protein